MLFPYSIEQRPGIAVLPFANFSGDPRDDYFSDGMTAEIINKLSRINRLPVIARSSSFEFKDSSRDIREIGRRLGVTHVLEGSVRKADRSFRLTVQLIDTTTGAHVWSGIYQREMSEIFALQDEIATEVADQIYLAFNGRLPGPGDIAQGKIPLPTRHTDNFEAYDLYLQGMQLLRSRSPITIEQSAGYFDRAIAADDNYADAWAAKGLAIYALGRPGWGHPHIPASVYPDAIAAFKRALEIEPGHALATGWLGAALIANDYQWNEGIRLIEESLARDPSDADLWSVYALHLRFMQKDGAEEALYAAFRQDSYGMVPVMIRIGALQREGRVLEAAALMEIILQENRDGYAPNYQAAVLNILLGRLNAAEQHIKTARQWAHPVDLSLDGLEWVIKSLRGEDGIPPVSELHERMRTERFSFYVDRGSVIEWEDAETIVAAFDLAMEQRLPEMRRVLFNPRPPLMPEADWRRMQDMAGVTKLQQAR